MPPSVTYLHRVRGRLITFAHNHATMLESAKSRAILCRDSVAANFTPRSDGGGMGKEERKEMVLDILRESDLALPPGVIFRNLKYRGATFERRSLDNYLQELLQEGYVEKVDPDVLEDGQLEPIESSESGYFVLTDLAVDDSE